MKTLIKIVVVGFIALVLMGGCLAALSGGEETTTDREETVEVETTEEPAETKTKEPAAPKKTKEPAPEPEPEPEPEMSLAQENAVQSAEDYLSFTAFSRTGLIEQLEFEGYSTADATFAVDYHKVDWNEQAAKSAQQYLDFSSFSRQELVDQLKFEGFTPEQAEYGVTQVGY